MNLQYSLRVSSLFAFPFPGMVEHGIMKDNILTYFCLHITGSRVKAYIVSMPITIFRKGIPDPNVQEIICL